MEPNLNTLTGAATPEPQAATWPGQARFVPELPPTLSPRREPERTDVSIVLPCLNEAQTLPAAIASARAALSQLAQLGLTGEIVVSDNGSSDGSVALAAARGCRVVPAARRGYGNALLSGIRGSRGRYVVMGDADGSYDFCEAVPMVRRLMDGYELCMGNRFTGEIRPGAMPWKNRYIGNPVLSGILNILFRARLGDAHCGLRAFTREAFDAMRLHAGGMEFASEMVVKAALLDLRRTEVPITLHPDGRDRAPHLRPYRDGWRHLRFMLMMNPFWLYLLPATLLLGFAACVFAALLETPAGQVFRLGGLWIGDHWLILAGGAASIGYMGLILTLVALAYGVREGYRRASPRLVRVCRWCSLERALGLAGVLAAAGMGLLLYVFCVWRGASFGPLAKTREMVLATALLVNAVQTVFGGFLLAFVGVEAVLEAGDERAARRGEP